ncbi:MAG: helix-turn-helix transcriptional regulator [Arachnia sp.]
MAIDKELVKGTLPMLVLQLTSEGDTYGYELIKAISARSGGTFTFSEGTLYPVLHALERDGLVASRWEAAAGLRRRKYYGITAAGSAALEARREEWGAYSAAVRAVLGGER